MTVAAESRPSGSTMDFATALDDAIDQLRAGASLEQCLAAQPAVANDLRPLLEMAQRTIQVAPAVPLPGAKARVRAAVLAAAEQRLARRPWWQPAWLRSLRLHPAGFAAAGAAALLALGGAGALVASASSLPGEPLYPVKLATEAARLAVTQVVADPQAQAQFHVELAERRVAEAEQLVEHGQPVPPDLVESALSQAGAAEQTVAQLPEPQRAQAAAALAAAQDRRTETLTRLEQREQTPAPVKTAIARALAEHKQQRDERKGGAHDDHVAAAVSPATDTDTDTDTAGGASASLAPESITASGEDERKDDRGGPRGDKGDPKDARGGPKDDRGGPKDDKGDKNDDHPGDRAGAGNSRDEDRGRPAAAGAAGTIPPAPRDSAPAADGGPTPDAADAGRRDDNRHDQDDQSKNDRSKDDHGRPNNSPGAQPAASQAGPTVTLAPRAQTNLSVSPTASARPAEPRDDRGGDARRDTSGRDDRGTGNNGNGNSGGSSGGSGGSSGGSGGTGNNGGNSGNNKRS